MPFIFTMKILSLVEVYGTPEMVKQPSKIPLRNWKCEKLETQAGLWTPKFTSGLWSDLLRFKVFTILYISSPLGPDHLSHDKSKEPLCLDL